MMVQYRANGETRDLSVEASQVLVDAGIADMVEKEPKEAPPTPPKPTKAPKPATDKPTKVEPMTTEDFPAVTTPAKPL
jgi:hypothetical protein